MSDADTARPAEAAGAEPPIRPDYLDLIRSGRVSERTRRALLDRAEPAVPGAALLSEDHMAVLRAVVDRALPQPGPGRLDLAARILADLGEGGDGWRFGDLPPDALALPAGLRTLAEGALADTGRPFPDLDGDAQDALLGRVAEGRFGAARSPRPGHLSAPQMVLWFEDLRSTAVRLYVAHPATLARMGYSGIANGGEAFQGFERIGPGEAEAWEPPSGGGAAR